MIMETKIIDGQALARRLRDEAASAVRAEGLDPGLAAILAGDDPASHLYVSLKEKACAEAGIRFEKHLFPADAAQDEVVGRIRELNARDDVDAILVQLPLPAHFDEDAVIAEIAPEKDVDGFGPAAVVRPGLATGLVLLAEASGRPLDGASVAVMANSKAFADPVLRLFLERGARKAERGPLLQSKGPAAADFVVVAVGRPGALTKDMIKEGAVVLDVGTNRLPDGRVAGDAADLSGHAGAVTPVPGGVGPVTVAMLLKNTVELARRHRGM